MCYYCFSDTVLYQINLDNNRLGLEELFTSLNEFILTGLNQDTVYSIDVEALDAQNFTIISSGAVSFETLSKMI